MVSEPLGKPVLPGGQVCLSGATTGAAPTKTIIAQSDVWPERDGAQHNARCIASYKLRFDAGSDATRLI